MIKNQANRVLTMHTVRVYVHKSYRRCTFALKIRNAKMIIPRGDLRDPPTTNRLNRQSHL